jgi:hypothetical protein
MSESPFKPVLKRAKKGFRGYPVATVAFYGPDKNRATKIAVGIIPGENAEPSAMERWFSEIDVRRSARIGKEIADFIRANGALSVVVTDGIIGCPHEEGTDYPAGQSCPQCPFWEGRDRWSGEYKQ